MPAGHIDEGENAIDAVIREAKEELNIEYSRISSVKQTENYYIFSITNSKTKIFVSNKIENLQEQIEFKNFINNKMKNSKAKIK